MCVFDKLPKHLFLRSVHRSEIIHYLKVGVDLIFSSLLYFQIVEFLMKIIIRLPFIFYQQTSAPSDMQRNFFPMCHI